MSTDPLERPTPRTTDWSRESRLREIRREAEKKGRVDAIGIRPSGAPFPVASPETGYYGLPLLKQPPWTWQIPLYFFAGGAAGSAAVIGIAARWIGHDRRLARDCRYIAAAGTALSSGLLISDLGRPSRFLAMMRVFKPQSPMSVGAWTLAVFGTFSAAAAFAEWANRHVDSVVLRSGGNFAEGISALAGLPFSNYTGVLIGASVIPLWNENVGSLPIHFGMSGLNSAVSMLELMGHNNSALNTLGMGASAIETLEGYKIETSSRRAMEPLKRGPSGLVTRIGGVLSGPIPLFLRVAAAFAGRRSSHKLRRAAAISSIAGSMLTRIAWIHAGHVSAKDWRLPLQVDRARQSPQKSHLSNISDPHKMP
ncbi:MAG: NrfD/PsrC family molybdoenzyme membrane anchor subunit [Candidatus Korobacteraceae bacterium]